MRAVAVVPARYGSTRFPGKPLAALLGRPMIAWVVSAARRASRLDAVWVATDDLRIAEAAAAAGAEVAMTSPDCPSGSDRAAEVARRVEADVYVNLQGDEPLVEPDDVDALVAAFLVPEPPQMATLARPAATEDLWNPDVVKVVCASSGDALYFSRAPIPWYRDAWGRGASGAAAPAGLVGTQRHLGVYAYAREALLRFPELPVGRFERAECLEQLRALEAGWRIRVLPARSDSIGVDRPEDLARAAEALRSRLGTGRGLSEEP